MRVMNHSFSLLALSFGALLSSAVACGDKPANTGGTGPTPSASTVATTEPTPTTSASTTPPPSGDKTKEAAHKLAIQATGCWLGGLWSEAEGDDKDVRSAAIESRCAEVAKRAYGSDDKVKVEQLRALESKHVADLASKVQELAMNDSVDGARKDNLVKMVNAIADAQRELMWARRAGEKVRKDEDVKDHDKLTKDEVDAVGPMRAHAALEALLKLDVGDLTKEAHAIGVLTVMARVNVARGLPRHLKMYAWGDGLQLLFGVPLPPLSDDVTKKLVPTQLLAYMMDVAKAAGHPVADKIAAGKDAQAKYALAYSGMLEGISDKLKADSDGVSPETELQKVVIVVENRLAAESRAQQAAHPADGPPKTPPKPGKNK